MTHAEKQREKWIQTLTYHIDHGIPRDAETYMQAIFAIEYWTAQVRKEMGIE